MTVRSVGSTHVALDVQNRAASVAIPTTPTQLILPTVITQIGIGYNNVSGVYTTPVTGLYDTILQFNVSAAAARTFWFYLEGDTAGGTSYVIQRYSARQVNVNAATDGQIIMASTNFFTANTTFRFYFWVTGGAANVVSTDASGTVAGTVTVPAMRVMITGT